MLCMDAAGTRAKQRACSSPVYVHDACCVGQGAARLHAVRHLQVEQAHEGGVVEAGVVGRGLHGRHHQHLPGGCAVKLHMLADVGRVVPQRVCARRGAGIDSAHRHGPGVHRSSMCRSHPVACMRSQRSACCDASACVCSVNSAVLMHSRAPCLRTARASAHPRASRRTRPRRSGSRRQCACRATGSQ
jgi:hypothetical protein